MRLRGLVLLGVVSAVLGATARADATPVIQLRARPAPIPGFRPTGNIAGAGAEIDTEIVIHGSEYGGFPLPLIGFGLYLPAGVELHPEAFPTCALSPLEPQLGPRPGCARASRAGPAGAQEDFVAFGREIVPERITTEAFFAPGGGLTLLTRGHEPVPLETLANIRLFAARGAYSAKLEAPVPLIETVPGAQEASTSSIELRLGAALEKNGEDVYFVTFAADLPAGASPVQGRTDIRHGYGRDRRRADGRRRIPRPLPFRRPSR